MKLTAPSPESDGSCIRKQMFAVRLHNEKVKKKSHFIEQNIFTLALHW